MTVPVGPNFAAYVGDGITTVFPYDFRIPTDENVEVTLVVLATGVETVLLPSQYAITGIGLESLGGTVTYPLSGTPLASTHRIVIRRIAPYTQPIDLRNQGGYYPESVEFAFDWLEFQIQQIAELIDRSVVVPPGEEGIVIIPGADGFLPQYDSEGNLTQSLDPALFTSGAAPAFGVVGFGPWLADGVQVSWTLPVAPALSANLLVYIDGVYQETDDRSTAGTTLTFVNPPPAGTHVSGVIIAVSAAVQTPTPGSVNATAFDFGDSPAIRTGLSVYSKSETDTKVNGVGWTPIPSAATVDLGAANGDFGDITGVIPITSFGTAPVGVERTVRFTGVLTLTHNATSLILYSGTNITTFNGLVMRFRSLGSGNWIEVSQTPARGTFSTTVAFGGASVGATYNAANTNASTWWRHGKRVIVNFYLRLSAKGSSVGTASIGGLPFPDTPGNAGLAVGILSGMAGLTGMIFGGPAGAGTTNINLRQWAATGTTAVNDTHFTDTSWITGTITYEVS